MKRLWIIILIIAGFSISANGQLYREPLFGLDIEAYKWNMVTDQQYFDAPYYGRLGKATDAARLRFATVNDTTDIFLIVDQGMSKIHWLRRGADPADRSLQHIGEFGEIGTGPGEFICNMPIAIASITPSYDHATDHIFIGDRMTHRIDRLNFEFYPDEPQSDRIYWESSTFVDTSFAPIDLEYVDFGTSDRYDNRLFALDDIGCRLGVFSHDGDLMALFDLEDPADTLKYFYRAMTHKVNNNGSVTLYLADRGNTIVRRFLYSRQGQLSFVNEINIGDRMQTTLIEIVYSELFGLWAVESRGPHLYKLAENLSRVLFEVSGEEFDPQSLFYIHKIAVLPERIVVFEVMGAETGLQTFAFDPPSGKRESNDREIIPFVFALSQNYPNPFNPNTIVRFEIPQSDWVKLEIFNILGQKVKTLVDEYKNAGPHSVIWNGANSSGRQVATGVYFTRLSSGQKTEVKKMLLLR